MGMNDVSEFQLRNRLTELTRAGERLQEFCAQEQLGQEVAHAFDLTLAEWLTNIISHGFDDASERWIEVRLKSAGRFVEMEIEDDGRPFNPLTHPPVDTAAPLENRAIGGLGIHMIRRLIDRVEYRREGNRNVVTFTKRR